MDKNMANRQCCDLDIRDYKTGAPFLFADWCNTTTVGFSSESVFAMKKGSKEIGFPDPIQGTMSLEFQVHPFKMYSLLSDGVIETTGIIPKKTRVIATKADELALPVGTTPVLGTLFVFADGDWGGTPIEGTWTGLTFAPKTPSSIAIQSEYEVGYQETVNKGINKVSFNNKKVPRDYSITQSTLDKSEDGTLVPLMIIAYKATIKRNLDLSFSSTGDPASIKLEFDVLTDKNGNVLDFIEITE